MGRRIFLCVGNPDRGDDGVGARVAALLRESAVQDVVECCGEAGDILAALEEVGEAIIVDASFSGAPAGTVRRFDLAAEGAPLSLDLGWSSHGFGLAEAIGLARALGALPSVCVLFTIEGESFAPGAPLSAAAQAGAAAATARILADFRPKARSDGAAFSPAGKIVPPCPQSGKTL
ncbi:hydrogenase maturation protease [Methylosinus sp. LW4]|uniref:hydrogenase maturation protease n=1 Tax=Methylosinus sp. LW4 TaxID=136993 RepID=UPI0003802B81|nr:hydrogenase maturation protease [Methylosinus sp. LW4]